MNGKQEFRKNQGKPLYRLKFNSDNTAGWGSLVIPRGS